MRKHLLLISASLVLSLGSGDVAAGQQVPSDDALAREAARQRDRSALAIGKADRQAQHLRQPVPDVGEPSQLQPPDPAEIARRYEANPKAEAGLFVLISLSIPAASLEQLAAQAGKAGATLVLRGVIDGSLNKTAEWAAGIIRKHPDAQFQIDPGLFRRFDVTQVPAFVVASQGADASCGGNCPAGAAYARVAGDVTLDYALDYLAKHSGKQLASIAERRLQQMPRQR